MNRASEGCFGVEDALGERLRLVGVWMWVFQPMGWEAP